MTSPRKFTVTAWSSDGRRGVAIKGRLNPAAIIDEENAVTTGQIELVKWHSRWTDQEAAELETLWRQGKRYSQIASELGRTLLAVHKKLRGLGCRTQGAARRPRDPRGVHFRPGSSTIIG